MSALMTWYEHYLESHMPSCRATHVPYCGDCHHPKSFCTCSQYPGPAEGGRVPAYATGYVPVKDYPVLGPGSLGKTQVELVTPDPDGWTVAERLRWMNTGEYPSPLVVPANGVTFSLAPGTEKSALPTSSDERKDYPLASGFLDYFPDAVAAVAAVSRQGQKQHGTTGWDRSKSPDEADCLMRHFMERGTIDTDGHRHSAKAAWRALALLQKEIEASRSFNPDDSTADQGYPSAD